MTQELLKRMITVLGLVLAVTLGIVFMTYLGPPGGSGDAAYFEGTVTNVESQEGGLYTYTIINADGEQVRYSLPDLIFSQSDQVSIMNDPETGRVIYTNVTTGDTYENDPRAERVALFGMIGLAAVVMLIVCLVWWRRLLRQPLNSTTTSS